MGQSSNDNPLWLPSPQAAAETAMGRFMSACADQYGIRADYASLHRWSVAQPAEFWADVARFTRLRFGREPDQVFVPGVTMRDAHWFVGATLNYAENLLRGDDDDVAIIFCDERGRRTTMSRSELTLQVRQLAQALSDLGVNCGDRVVAMLPNCPEAAVTMLAAAAIGAVFSSCSPDFGTQAILDRFGQIEPKVLFGCDGYSYGGKRIDCLKKLIELQNKIPGLQETVLVSFLHDEDSPSDGRREDNLHPFAALLSGDGLTEFPQLPFEHPLFVMYSSGTTGIPKCIVHSAGGTLVQHLKEHVLHTNLGRHDRLLYFTTCGWMMWNWLIGALASGATVVLYEGSPAYPDALTLWRHVENEKVTVFGTSPRFLLATQKAHVLRNSEFDLDSLRTVLSTGSPLSAESYDFVATNLPHVQLCSISGGTEIISCFVLGNPLLPVYRGEIQSPGLGMAVDVVDADGSSVREKPGELICRQAFPSMPLGFWNDTDGVVYQQTYFQPYPDCWRQGDLAEITSHDGIVIYGRSDTVLNPGGVRMGTAEICAPALSVDGVIDAIAVGQRQGSDERVVLFVVTAKNQSLNDEMCARIRQTISQSTSPRHVPAVILEVADIPRTVSGKAMELAVRAVIHGEDVPNRGSLANPEALQYFKNRPELA
jgi:acetoacetyl-CoA synthetase